jgi:gluconolactonase
MTSRVCFVSVALIATACGSAASKLTGASGSGQGSGSTQATGASSGAGSGTTTSGQVSGQTAGTSGTPATGSGAGGSAGSSTGSSASGQSAGATTGAGAGGGATTGAITSGSTADAGTYTKRVCPTGPFLAPVGTNRQNVCTGFKFNYGWNEGPVWVASLQAFLFSNFSLDATTNFIGDIVKYTPSTGQCEIWLAGAGTNGMGIAPDGNLLAAVNTTQSITEFDLGTKTPKILVDHYMGKTFNSPNDLIVHSNGTIYFTDPDYQRGNRPQQLPLSVYRIDPTGAISLIEVAKEPNGITLSPDEKFLYVEQDNGGGLGVFDLDANGVPVGASRPFAGNTDGIAMDCAGDVYESAGGGIFSPAGMSLGMIPGSGGTHPTFGGSDWMTLIVVGDGGNTALGTQVSTVQYNVPGIQ